MPKYSLFIGRFQPLHDGHKALLRSVLAEGRNVCIGLRATGIDADNPYSIEDRQEMFWDAFPDEMTERRMVLVVLPDIEEVCYGRKVGWGIREIRLDEATEAISGTAIRGQS